MPRPAPVPSWRAVVTAVARRPELWATAVGQVFRLSPTGWWRRAPFVPRPDPAYVRFRITTQQGGGDAAPSGSRPPIGATPDPDDVVEYLRWCRALGSPAAGRPSRR